MERPQESKRLVSRSTWRFSLAAAAGDRRWPGGWLAVAANAVSGAGPLSRFGVGAGAGVLAALSLAPYHFIPLIFVAFTLLTWLIDGLGTLERRLVSAAWIGWSFGVGFFGLGLYWIGNAFLVDAKTYGSFMLLAVGLLVAGLALFPALAIVLARLFWRTDAARIIVLALAWTATEWIRGHILTGFPWNLVAYVWGDSLVMLQGASLFGVYGLSLATVFAAAAPAVLIEFSSGAAQPARAGAFAWPGFAAVLLAGAFAFGVQRLGVPAPPNVPGVMLRIVQPSIAQARKLSGKEASAIFKTHMDLMARPGIDQVTHVIWSEAAVPAMLQAETTALGEIGAALRPNQWLLAGSARFEPGGPRLQPRFFNSLLLISHAGAVVSAYDKHHLVPFGEYLPMQWLLARVGFKQLVETDGGFTPGPAVETLHVPGAPDAGALVCYEAIFPGEVVDRSRRPGWLLNITDDTWFGHGVGPRQHFEIARARAVEEGLPFVRAANNGISAVIDARGRILKTLDFDVVGDLDSPLPGAEPPTLYAALGDNLFFALWLIAALAAFALTRLSARPTES